MWGKRLSMESERFFYNKIMPDMLNSGSSCRTDFVYIQAFTVNIAILNLICATERKWSLLRSTVQYTVTSRRDFLHFLLILMWLELCLSDDSEAPFCVETVYGQ